MSRVNTHTFKEQKHMEAVMYVRINEGEMCLGNEAIEILAFMPGDKLAILTKAFNTGRGRKFFTVSTVKELSQFFYEKEVRGWSTLADYFRNQLGVTKSLEIEELIAEFLITERGMEKEEAEEFLQLLRIY